MKSNWNLTIRAEGDHHSEGDTAKDADEMARKFVGELRAAGHDVLIANFTPGEDDLSRPKPAPETT